VRFPHANEEMSDEEFIAYWGAWFAGPTSPGMLCACSAVPNLASAVGMQTLYDQNNGHGLDALCRKIVHPAYRNTMQATRSFMTANAHMLEQVSTKNPHTGQIVKGARLTKRGLEVLRAVRQNAALMRDALAVLEADADITGAGGEPTTLQTNSLSAPPQSINSKIYNAEIIDRQTMIARLVQTIEIDPFNAFYRLREYGAPVTGWSDRLNAYFWPNPQNGFVETMTALARLTNRGQRVAQAPRPWDEATAMEAVSFATDVLTWGGVPQRSVTPAIVDAVIQAALTRQAGMAPMNSGWTKVAAFATAYLEEEGRANAIWDSRVSWSLVRRIDHLLAGAGWQKVPAWLPDLGKVGGRGGTRWSKPLSLRWPNGYANWPAHFAATALISDIRDYLNSSGRTAPSVSGGSTAWTVRTVEMVLFMDGY